MNCVPMIYNGQEVATRYRLTFPFTTTTINWSGNEDVTAEYTKIIAFRKSSDGIKRGLLTSYSSVDVSAFTKIYGSEKILVLANLRNKSVIYSVPSSLISTAWEDVFASPTASVTLDASITLAPYQYRVFQIR